MSDSHVLVIELKDKETGEVYWRNAGNGVPLRATETGRTGKVKVEDIK